MAVKVGDLIPEMLGVDQDGKEITRESLKNQKVVLYVYPKDNTSGCTAEACSLRDDFSKFTNLGYRIIGVSKDSAKSHKNFKEKHDLPFDLIVDSEATLMQALGAWGEKSMYGRKYMGALRTTFLVNEEGRITHIFVPKQIKTKVHAAQLLKAIEE